MWKDLRQISTKPHKISAEFFNHTIKTINCINVSEFVHNIQNLKFHSTFFYTFSTCAILDQIKMDNSYNCEMPFSSRNKCNASSANRLTTKLKKLRKKNCNRTGMKWIFHKWKFIVNFEQMNRYIEWKIKILDKIHSIFSENLWHLNSSNWF